MTSSPLKPPDREAYEKQIFDLLQLLEISKLLNSTLDYNILMDSILFTCMGQMKVVKAGVLTKKAIDHDYFTLHRNYKGFDFNNTKDYTVPEQSALISHFKANYKCFTLEELDSQFQGEELSVFKDLTPSLIIPLKAKGFINGIIILGERIDGEPFSEEEKAYLLDIAMFASIAIQNAFLFEMSTTDMMTKLKLKHFFFTALKEHMERAAVSGTSLSVMMIDIDHFKNFNDTYGHTCGDLMLTHVTALLKTHIRQVDIAARYGGEEFVILLPDASGYTAEHVGERIRQIIQKSSVQCGGEEIKTTISLGVAQYDPERDVSIEKFLCRADNALYRAKHMGRNCLCVAD